MSDVLELEKRELDERVDLTFNLDPATIKELAPGTFSAVVTTSAVDRTQESITTSGISYDAYMQNPVVLYGHDYSSLPIGKTLSIKTTNNKMTAKFQLAVDEYPFAKTVSDLILGGYLGAVSIGGIVKQWSPDWSTIEEMEMVEFSVVPVPANSQALIARSFEKITGKTTEQVNEEFHDFAAAEIAKSIKGIDNDELTTHIKTLETLLGILKASKADQVQSGDKSEKEIIRLTLKNSGKQIAKTGESIIRLTKASKV